MNETALKKLEPLLGAWSVEVRLPGAEGVLARTEFEWLLGGQFLVQRTEVPHPDAPDSFAIIGVEAQTGSYTQHYYDSRGVARVYSMEFGDGRWTLLREWADFSPHDFSQRFVGEFGDDGSVIEARWEMASGGRDFELDFELTYTRVE